MDEPKKRYVYGGMVSSMSDKVHTIRDTKTHKIIGAYAYAEMISELERLNNQEDL